jgi:hypothetical protein
MFNVYRIIDILKRIPAGLATMLILVFTPCIILLFSLLLLNPGASLLRFGLLLLGLLLYYTMYKLIVHACSFNNVRIFYVFVSILMFTPMIGSWGLNDAIIEVNGVRTSATITKFIHFQTSSYDSNGNFIGMVDHYHCKVNANINGQFIPSEVSNCASTNYKVNQTIEVVYDPQGWVSLQKAETKNGKFNYSFYITIVLLVILEGLILHGRIRRSRILRRRRD